MQALPSALAGAHVLAISFPFRAEPASIFPGPIPRFLRGHPHSEQIHFMFDWEEGEDDLQAARRRILRSTVPCSSYRAGRTTVALGVAVRRDEIEDTPGEITLAGNAWGASEVGITAGHSVTKETFGEISLPLLVIGRCSRT